MLTVMPIAVVPCLLGGYWLFPSLRLCCQSTKVAPEDGDDAEIGDVVSTKTRVSYWTKASRAGQSYYYRWQTPGLKVKESTLVLPKEDVLRTEEQLETTAFEEGFAEAERMDALRSAGQLNLESPWTAGVDDEGVFYWRWRDPPNSWSKRSISIVSELPEEGVKGDYGRLRREEIPEPEPDDY